MATPIAEIAHETLECTTKSCDTTAYSYCDVSTPITVSPYAKIGTVTSRCCGTPKIGSGEISEKGRPHGSCTYVISQRICVEIPVEFGATVKTGTLYVECLGASADNQCSDEFDCGCDCGCGCDEEIDCEPCICEE